MSAASSMLRCRILNGVTTYSTGTEPGRRVVIAPDSSYRSHH